jgi:imidazolonepropionase
LADFCDCFAEEHIFPVIWPEQLESAGSRIKDQGACRSTQAQWSDFARYQMNAVSIDHLEHINQQDIQALANSNAIATLLPGSVYLGHPYPLLDAACQWLWQQISTLEPHRRATCR